MTEPRTEAGRALLLLLSHIEALLSTEGAET